MAMPSPEIVLGVTKYLQLVERYPPKPGVAKSGLLYARAQFQRTYPGFSAAQLQEITRLAQQAQRTGERLAALEPEDKLSKALGKLARPAQTVSVRVDYVWVDANNKVHRPHANIEMRWDQTVQDLHNKIQEALAELVGDSDVPADAVPDYSGPTLFPH